MSQLALPLKLKDHAVFDTFYDDGNEALVPLLQELCSAPRGPGYWLWSRQASGKSHLLQAVCNAAGASADYLPLTEIGPAGPGVLDGLADGRIVCLDDVHLVAGDPDWERALFRLYNAALERNAALVVTSTAAPAASGIAMPDLESRFSQLAVFQVRSLDDTALGPALKLRARHRGLDLPDETVHFLLTRQQRDMANLYALLDRLDDEALAAKRRLTIPFVKSVLGEQ